MATDNLQLSPPMRARLSCRLLLYGLLCLAAGLPGTAAAEESPLTGTWSYSGGEEQKQQRLDAIDEAIQHLPRLFRGIARKRLRRSALEPIRYTVRDHGETLTISLDDGPSRTTPVDGTPVTFEDAERGEPLVLTRTRQGNTVHSVGRVGEGTASSSFHFEGDRLDVEIALAAKQLPEPVRYTLSFRRESSP